MVVTACVGAGSTSVAKLMCASNPKNAAVTSRPTVVIGPGVGWISPIAGPAGVGIVIVEPGEP